jgi:hypothetical protein
VSKISELSDGGSLVSTDYLIVVRSGGNVKVKMDTINVDQVDLGDNEMIRLGNSQDLTLVHTSTQSIINQAGVGDLLLQKAGTTKASITANGLEFPDNSKAIFGAGSDLQIYHDGSNSWIQDLGTGNLVIRGTNLNLQKVGGESYITMVADGAVTAFYDNAAKLATTASGIQVTGDISNTSGDMALDVAGDIILDADGGDVFFKDGGSTIAIAKMDSSNFTIQTNNNDKDIIFKGYDSDGGGLITALTLDMSAAGAALFQSTVAIGTSTPVSTAQLTIGGTSRIAPVSGNGLLLASGGSDAVFISTSGSVGIGTTSPSAETPLTAYYSSTSQMHLGGAGNLVSNNTYFNGTAWANRNSAVGGAVLQLLTDGSFAFRRAGTGASPTLTYSAVIDASGNVGIGTNSPIAKIHATTSTAGYTARLINTNGASDANGLLIQAGTGGSEYSLNITNTAGTTNFMVVKGDGNVGIGTATPSGKLSIEGGTATSEASHITFANTEGAKVFAIGGGKSGVSNNGFSIINVTDNTAPLTVSDAGNVGIGTSTPSKKLTVTEPQTANTAVEVLRLSGSGTYDSGSSTNAGAGLSFGQYHDTYPSWNLAQIDGIRTGSSWGGSLIFKTNDSTAQANSTERMRIDSSGNLLVGGTSTNPTGQNVAGAAIDASGEGNFSVDGAEALRVNRKTSNGTIVNYMKDGATVGSWQARGDVVSTIILDPRANGVGLTGASNVLFPTDNAGSPIDASVDLGISDERFKDLYLSGGVVFGTTGGAVSSKTLEDYEEGTWTPAFSGADTNTGASNSGSYVKIGQLVHCTFKIVQSALTGTGTATMTGLPFTCANLSNPNAFSVQDCGHTTNTVTTDNGRFRCISESASLQGVKSLGSTTYMTYDQLYDGSGSLEFTGQFTYRST